MTYRVTGKVRGDCGHEHTTLRGAAKCCVADEIACEGLGGGAYSDRRVVREDGAPLSETELRAMYEIKYGEEVAQ